MRNDSIITLAVIVLSNYVHSFVIPSNYYDTKGWVNGNQKQRNNIIVSNIELDVFGYHA